MPDGGELLIVVASDGAGSAKLSQIGSTETCRFVTQRVRDLCSSGAPPTAITKDMAIQLVLDAQENLRTKAGEAGATLRDVACTLVAGVVAADSAIFLQVGDGVAVVGDRNEGTDDFCWVFWPERGEYANTTCFLSDENVAEHVMFDGGPRRVDEIALLTDGIQHMVLDYKSKAAHAPFFRRMMVPLRGCRDAGHVAPLSTALAGYLDSTTVNERTDDDKTLILASRRFSDGE